jgi:hypothetical protein
MSEEAQAAQPIEVPLNVPGMKPKAPPLPTVERAWFPDEVGRHGKPIELDGAKFFAREVKKSALRQFSTETRRIQHAQTTLSQQQEAEIKALEKAVEAEKKAAVDRGEDEPVISAQLSDERLEYFDNEAERLADEWDAAHNALLEKGIVGWSFPRPFDIEVLKQFAKVDKVALCQAIGARSSSGYDAAKN